MFFFFFKQKTAYEMRISDWSSDVCSSDLKRADARDELTRIERLGHVVVGPDLKTDNPVNVFAQRRQHDDGYSGGRAQPAADAEPDLAGQHDVQHHEVDVAPRQDRLHVRR